jgi:hypothetical protein
MYEHLFSCASVLSVWKNLRAGPGQDGLVVTFQYGDMPRGTGVIDAVAANGVIRKLGAVGGGFGGTFGGPTGTVKASQIGLIVPWRSLREQERQAREREREVAEYVVRLVGEVGFEGLCISTAIAMSVLTRLILRTSSFSSTLRFLESLCTDPSHCRRYLTPDEQSGVCDDGQCAVCARQESTYRRRSRS